MTTALRFDGRPAVVTGGARGIGRGIAERLASLGAEVHVVDRDAAPAASGIPFHAADLADSASVARVVAALPRPPLLLVNTSIEAVTLENRETRPWVCASSPSRTTVPSLS